ncbi:outer membrane protein [Rhizorhabdus sp.]|jgi:outer membrane immunogenic protein|uniref:outer membrane protein n=1 Tax=Rhizorhabdus sp. TaxID=1968843 RepID=UPI0025E01C8B|nr:outer membrane beta-barrel protein [Rhizorhabdus sp.]
MRFFLTTTAAAGLVAAMAASAASAQDVASSNWTGFYVGGQLGYNWQPTDGDEVVNFDRNRDGNFGDAFPNFSPGFCGGAPTSARPTTGCSKDNDSTAWKLHAGYDYQFGDTSGPVVGLIAEYGKSYLYDNVTAFSTTPAVYKLQAKLKSDGAIRARAGYSFETGTLIYGTGGAAYGKIRNSFSMSNTVNSATVNDPTKNAWGWTYGGGIEQKIGKFSVGALYTFTALKNNDSTVTVGSLAGVTPATNPFIAQNAAGTDFQRSFSKFAFHSVRATVSYRF